MTASDTRSANDSSSHTLATSLVDKLIPQTPRSKCGDSATYRYVHVEDTAAAFFHGYGNGSSISFSPNQLVWVCKSKGLRRSNNKKKNKGKNCENESSTTERQLAAPDETTKCDRHSDDGIADKSEEHHADEQDQSLSEPTQQRLELFLRARVVGDDVNDESLLLSNDQSTSQSISRIRVRYPKGSTYACKPAQLLPVLEHTTGVILVAAETSDYRRACVLHTLPTDDFLEVGCAFGATVDRIYQTGADAGHLLPAIKPPGENADIDSVTSKDETATSDRRRIIVGVDKSTESISIATKRYPHLHFCECDLLAEPFEEWPEVLQTLQPAVIAVDINGNRELPAVLHCLQVLLKVYQPRLIICKSRALHAIL